MPRKALLPVIGLALLATGCASEGPAALSSNSLVTSSVAAGERSTYPTRALRGEPTRLFVFVGLDAACKPVPAHNYTVEASPTKGRVTFQKNQETTVQYSLSGNCIGKRVAGTAVYYTPNGDAVGADTFSVMARLANGERVVREFKVAIPD